MRMHLRLGLATALLATFFTLVALGARAEAPLKVVLVSGSFEYDSDKALTIYKQWLETHYQAEVTLLSAKGWEDLPGLEALDTCDTALFYTRRLKISGEQLERVKRYLGGGKPFVAVRTASHGFQGFLEFDKEVLGGNYANHLEAGPTQETQIVPGAADHPILQGVGTIRSRYSIYRTGPLAPDTQELLHVKTMDGKAPIFWARGTDKKGKSIQEDADQPVAWTREHAGGRLMYTSLGGVSDFENAAFQTLIANGLFWTAKREPLPRALPELSARVKSDVEFTLPLRARVDEGGAIKETNTKQSFRAAETALVLCDVWDQHWCAPATARLDAMIPQMDAVVRAARAAGVQIIHAPSDTMNFYRDTPGRRRAQAAPPAPQPSSGRVSRPEPALPIDDSDGGCDDNGLQPYGAWTRQHPGIGIEDIDAISDDGHEVYNLLAQEGIKHLIVLGVHTNMCVLNRGFAIRQMSKWGIQCYLVRDLTDAMYDPQDPPKVSHEEGTASVVAHIEQYWAPSFLSGDLFAALPTH